MTEDEAAIKEFMKFFGYFTEKYGNRKTSDIIELIAAEIKKAKAQKTEIKGARLKQE